MSKYIRCRCRRWQKVIDIDHTCPKCHIEYEFYNINSGLVVYIKSGAILFSIDKYHINFYEGGRRGYPSLYYEWPFKFFMFSIFNFGIVKGKDIVKDD